MVEDEPDLRSALILALRDEGYAVDEAADGIEGLEKAEDWDYDAIVLDLMLPGMNGFELLRDLRKTKQTPVLILTARESAEDNIRGLDLGADDYVKKPFELEVMLARLRALIRRSAGHGSNEVTIGDIEVDLNARVVKKSGKTIQLTAKELMLVEFLVQHRGRWISRTQLYDHLFDEMASTASNLLDVHVSRVRKKLGSDFIQTRRGVGYSIDPRG